MVDKERDSTLTSFWIACRACNKQSLSLSWFERVVEANKRLYTRLFEYYSVRERSYYPESLYAYVVRDRDNRIRAELQKPGYAKLLFHCPYCNWEEKYPFTRYELDREFIMIYYGDRNVGIEGGA